MSTFQYLESKVWYQESGQGEPLIFLHNGGNDHRIWDHQVAYFSRNYRTIVMDHIGYGQSGRPDIAYTLPVFTGGVQALIDHLNLGRVTLIGHCIGGAMALNYAWHHPQKIARLVLFNIATEKTLCSGPLADVYRQFSQDSVAMEEFVCGIEQTGLTREQTDGSLQRQLGRTPIADDLDFAEYSHRLWNQPGQMRTLYNNLAQFDSFACLDGFTKPADFPPVCLFWGGENAILPPEGSNDLRERIRPERCEVLVGCGHLAMRERPMEVNRKIEAFFEATAGQRTHA